MQLGKFQLQLISAGCFSIDGGTVFGVVPKTIWGQQISADAQNRIRLGLNCLLVQAEDHNILVDCGMGDKFGPKQRDIYKIDHSTLIDTLSPFCRPEDIDCLILTHLHFDHVGGLTRYNPEGRLELTFPRAQLVVQKREWEAACSPNERNKGSYLTDSIQPLEESGRLQLVDGDHTLIQGVELLFTGGHSAGHQLIKLTSQGQCALFLGDLVPTSRHLHLPFITAYDIQPEETLKVKKEILAQAAAEGWLLIFEHDIEHKMGYIERVGQGDKTEYRLKPSPNTI
jgi:glyoxylase-like metal-dependent hydrolase (beta-lactamase superfamily II)